MPSTDSTTPPTTALLTLLNVSATRPGKRRRFGEAAAPSARVKLGGRTAAAVAVAEAVAPSAAAAPAIVQMDVDEAPAEVGAVDAAVESDDEAAPQQAAALDGHTAHFASEGEGTHAQLLARNFPNAKEGKLEELEWSESPAEGSSKIALGEGTRRAAAEAFAPVEAKPHANVLAALQKLRQQAPLTAAQRALLHTVGSYADILHTRSRGTAQESAEQRQVLAAHALSHLIKTRRRILRNNEKLAHAASAGTSLVSPRDQGFTRPTILILLPLRSAALRWGELLYALSGCETHDGAQRLEREFGPHPDSAEAGEHAGPEELRGNSDDSFRFGAKLTRKTWKSFTGWYDSDVIVASPLGLRLAIEKDRDADFLSSIEVVIADQMDVMMMQNWEHVQLIFSHLSAIPKASHGTDFSRVKQWHLDGRAAHFRQTILLSAYDAPELRAAWRALVNVAGKLRTGGAEEGVMSEVREGIRQTFTRFDCANLNAEADLRFQTFTSKTLPTLLKSAVSATRTLIFVPSYFDFVRLEAHMRTLDGVTFAAISEYSSNKDVARARQQFFTEKKAFLLVTERFHFYRRFTLRGAQTVAFYALPEHATYYTDVLSFPFAPPRPGKSVAADERPTLDAGDVSVTALYSRYDLMRLERVVGTKLAHRMVSEEKGTWRWA